MDDADILSYLILGRPLNQATGNDGRVLHQAATSLALIGGEALADRLAADFDLEELRIETGEESADTSLIVGKSLSPRLYIRYIQGLVDNAVFFPDLAVALALTLALVGGGREEPPSRGVSL